MIAEIEAKKLNFAKVFTEITTKLDYIITHLK